MWDTYYGYGMRDYSTPSWYAGKSIKRPEFHLNFRAILEDIYTYSGYIRYKETNDSECTGVCAFVAQNGKIRLIVKMVNY